MTGCRRRERRAPLGLCLALTCAALTCAALTCAALTCAALASPAYAQHGVHSAYWREVRAPGYARSRELLRQGRVLLALAARERGAGRNARVLSAIRRFRRAHELTPEDAEALFEWARAKASLRWPAAEGVETQAQEAQALLLELRGRFPDFEAQRVAFELGILAARAQDFPRAAREYRRALDARRVGEGAPSMHGNLAEVEMLAGQLEAAEAEYRLAVRLGRARPGRGLALSLFGLAVCLDRREQPRRALVMARRAMSAGGGGTDVLRSEGVFFEPAAELHYYEALALRARADDVSVPSERERLLRQAASALRRYLSGVDRESAFYSLAARRLEAVRRALTAARQGRTLRSGRQRRGR